MRAYPAIAFTLVFFTSCNYPPDVPASDTKDIMKFAGVYKGHAADCASCTCELLLEPTFNKTRIYIDNVTFGEGVCKSKRKVYGYVKNDSAIFPRSQYSDWCIGKYYYSATATLTGDTLSFIFDFDGYAPMHDTIVYVKK
ncbi:MAG: hypothetical protein KF744_06150 [Taibaiella sp.]|nr:hypothetical protein [Taibaiella sp.]